MKMIHRAFDASLIFAVFAILTFVTTMANVWAKDTWEKPGCHKIGHTRKISIPECIEFHMTTNACRGYCESWAVPSDPNAKSVHPVTSIGQCCNIMETEDVPVKVLCLTGVKTLTFKSATNCACYHCKKD